ncbi:MAG: P-loop NTPase, partial [Synergistaceae bacterium]|nr:P-loop NTPase [Synergistaceae bacterium]
VMSGKGGVGKSMVTALLAAECAKSGLRTAVMDADITGPSIPKVLGVKEKAMGGREGIFPAVSKLGNEVMSMN